MSNIDEKTGLPELPEDQRWFVREQSSFAGYGYWVSTGELEVVLQLRGVEVKPAYQQRVGRTWYGKRRYVTVPAASAESWSDLNSEVTLGKHPIAIRNAANKIVKRVAEKKRVNDLLGAYPPKKLEVEQ